MTAQNKETYLESMNEEYKQKHYPEGSVFKAHKKAMKGVNAGLGLFFMGAFLAGSIAGLVWSINRTLEIIRDKEENMLGVGIGISVFFLLLVAVFGVAVFFITKDIRKTVDDWIRVAAKAGGLEEQEIREFDKQAMGSDSLILNHLYHRTEEGNSDQGLYLSLRRQHAMRIETQPAYTSVHQG